MLSIVALLGKRDTLTDGIEDYCAFLGAALQRRGIEVEKARVDWQQQGWLRALAHLWRESAQWRGKWVLLQFTSLSWSRRGFPFVALPVVQLVRARGAHFAVVYHEPRGTPGPRWIDRVRSACQEWTIRRMYDLADLAVFPDALETISWLPTKTATAAAKAVSFPLARISQSQNVRNALCRRTARQKPSPSTA